MNCFATTDPIENIIHVIEDDGYAIIENVLNDASLAVLRHEIEPYLFETNPDAENAFMGERTKRFGRLLYRIPSTRSIVQNPHVLNILDRTLLRYSPTYQLSFTGVMHVMPGEKTQVLHRDQTPFSNPGPTVCLATMWAATEFKRENGATVLVPGSHKWLPERIPLKDELIVAEMKAGSVLFYASNLIHGAGKCVKGSRTGVSIQYVCGWLRQEENQYLAVPFELAKTFDESLQKLMGYDLAARNSGYVDQMHPMNFLNDTTRYGGLDQQDKSFAGRHCQRLNAVASGVCIDEYYYVNLDD